LIAFEAAGWVEVFALFAGVKIEAAFWALSESRGEVLQERSAFGAARDGARAGHLDWARSEGVFFLWSGGRLVEFFLSGIAISGILVSALPIFWVGQKSASLKTPHSPPLRGAAQGLLCKCRK